MAERGGASALPVVVQRHAPLTFRRWRRGDALEPGVWNIPVPADGAIVTPDIVIAPVVGFDPACFRLGYGGGFFDRTLAALPRRPRIVGVGYARQEIRTIFPQAHDVPMDMIVTEAGIVAPARAYSVAGIASRRGASRIDRLAGRGPPGPLIIVPFETRACARSAG